MALDEGLATRLGRAMHALGGLHAVGAFLPDPEILLYMYVRKEAVLSSQIEGTQSIADRGHAEQPLGPAAPRA